MPFIKNILLGACVVATLSANAAGPTSMSCPGDSHHNLDELLTEHVKAGRIVGGAGIISTAGVVIDRAAAGWADREHGRPMRFDTIFRIHSMTKPVVAVAALLLADRGELDLHAPIARHVPELARLERIAGTGTAAVRTPLTAHHLLTHTAGFTASFQSDNPVAERYRSAGLTAGSWMHDPDATLDGFVRRLSRLPLLAEPGERWHYGVSFDVLGLVIERITGQRLSSFLEANLFRPLGMLDTGFHVSQSATDRLAALYLHAPPGEPQRDPASDSTAAFSAPPADSGGGGLYSTLPDYHRFARMLAEGGVHEGRRILSIEAVNHLTRNHLGPAFGADPLVDVARFGVGGEGRGLGFGYGGAVLVDPARHGGLGNAGEYSWGGAASTTFWIDRSNATVAIIMTQLLPSGALSLRDELRCVAYGANRVHANDAGTFHR